MAFCFLSLQYLWHTRHKELVYPTDLLSTFWYLCFSFLRFWGRVSCIPVQQAFHSTQRRDLVWLFLTCLKHPLLHRSLPCQLYSYQSLAVPLFHWIISTSRMQLERDRDCWTLLSVLRFAKYSWLYGVERVRQRVLTFWFACTKWSLT